MWNTKRERYLATGESFHSLALRFRMGVSTVSSIIKECCKVIWNDLQEEYLPKPTSSMWCEIAHKFWSRWNFPNCIGSLDGKHIEIKCPPHSGSLYFNYKQYFSILLQAVADADCKLIAVDIGAVGRESDGGNFRSSSLFNLLEKNELNVPSDRELPGTSLKVPFVIVADESYPLLPYLMRPYAKRTLDNERRVFNYRLSRARRSVECAFRIMSNKWRILLKSIETDVTNAVHIVKAICILHNFVLRQESFELTEQNENKISQDNEHNYGQSQYRFSERAKRVRETFLQFFNGSGAILWQNDYLY